MYKYPKNIDRKFRLPRIWSNYELRKFAPLFEGSIINVSGYKDDDKQGGKYADYFKKANSYSISNFSSEVRGFEGGSDEIFIDLEKPLQNNLIQKFDVAFNHTTLEHVFDFHKAFENICNLSRDIVIIVVPFLQQMHGEITSEGFGDYWRFTPSAIKRLFEINNLDLIYSNYNKEENASVYLIAIGSRHPEKWKNKLEKKYYSKEDFETNDHFPAYIGCNAIQNTTYAKSLQSPSIIERAFRKIKRIFKV